MAAPSRHSECFSAILVLLLIFSASLGKLWEQDIYWLIRDGEYIIKNLSFQWTDTWSSTAQGKSLINAYWLSSVFFYFGSFFGPAGLVFLRGLLAVALFLFCYLWAKNVGKTNSALLAVALLYFAISYKIQVRPDFIIMFLFVMLRKIWAADSKNRIYWTFAILIAGCNFHQGVAPILYFAAMTEALKNYSFQKAILLTLAFSALYAANPSGIGVLPSIAGVLTTKTSAIINPDYASFGLQSFSFVQRGWSGLCIVLLSLVGWSGFYFSSKHRFARAEVIEGLMLFFLMILSLYIERAFPFFLIAILPHAVRMFEFPLPKMDHYVRIALALVVLLLFPAHFANFSNGYGFTVDEKVYPVESVKFIQEVKSLPTIYHTPIYGNYLLGNLRDYKVFVDTREHLFESIDQELADAFHSPEKTQLLLEKYGVNTILMPLHKIAMKSPVEFWDRLTEFFPKEKWALVFFDEISMVFVRRTEMHSEIIKKFEYQVLVPNLPPDYQVARAQKTPLLYEKLKDEAQRCLSKVPNQWICQDIVL